MVTTTQALTAVEQIVLVRYLEDCLQELCNEGLAGDLHFNKGQEALSVGVISELRPTDYVVTHHRTIAHAVAKGVPLKPLVAELLGKAAGLNGGMSGEMQLSDPASRFSFCWQLVGACVPVAAGLAWAVEYVHKTDDIVTLFHGDAATANGNWHEGMSLASLQKVPLLIICENNYIAGNVRPEHYIPTQTVRERAIAYGVQARAVDGNNLEAVQDMARECIAYVREQRRPLFLECRTARLGRHKQGMGDLRSKDEMAELAKRDPMLEIKMSEDSRKVAYFLVDEAITAALGAADPEFPKGV